MSTLITPAPPVATGPAGRTVADLLESIERHGRRLPERVLLEWLCDLAERGFVVECDERWALTPLGRCKFCFLSEAEDPAGQRAERETRARRRRGRRGGRRPPLDPTCK